MRKRRIAIIQEHPTQYHAPFYRYLSEHGNFDVKVLYLTNRGTKPFRNLSGVWIDYPKALLEGYEWEECRNLSPWQNNFRFYDNFSPDLFGRIRDGSFEAILFNGYNYLSNWVGFLACNKFNIPILMRGESETFFPRTKVVQLTKDLFLRPLFQRVAAFLYIGSYNREFYLEYGAAEEKLFFVPYGVDNAAFQATSEERALWRSTIRKELGLGNETVVFLYASQHRENKRPLDPVAAFCNTDPTTNAALIMLGDGVLRPDAEALFRAKQRGHRIFFLGMQQFEAVRKYFAAADVLLIPSTENFGGPLMEGMAAGIGMISSDHCIAWRDYIEPGVNGLVYRAESIPGLCSCIESVAKHPPLARAMRKASLERSSEFGFARMAEVTWEAVEYAIAKH